MAAAILGLVGVIVGFGLGQGYAFWATRRGELTAAVVAVGSLTEDFRRLRAVSGMEHELAQQSSFGSVSGERRDDGAGRTAYAQIWNTWNTQRGSLIPFMQPADFMKLVDLLPFGAEPLRTDGLDDAIERLGRLHHLLWSEHEAFILVPLLRQLRRYPDLSERIHELLD